MRWILKRTKRLALLDERSVLSDAEQIDRRALIRETPCYKKELNLLQYTKGGFTTTYYNITSLHLFIFIIVSSNN